MNIHVKNLPLQVTERDLRTFFEVFGKVEAAQVIINTRTGEPQGYGFVEMPVEEEALVTISTLNGKDWMGKTLSVTKANRQGHQARRKMNRRR